jgi:L-ascorbate metabolism protein UlaG (beta-lactamase superfamily)
MARFTHLANGPPRGPRDMLRWKVLDRLPGRRAPRSTDHDALDRVRPAHRDGAAAALAAGDALACWIGHASWVWRLGGQLVAIDPIWGAISGVVPRLVPPGVAFEALPRADVVLVTHDHRDHMDLATLRRFPDDALYVVPLGNAPRLAKLGKSRVLELDWWQTHREGALEITLVPARHWSMREPWNRNDTLWGGYVLRAPEGVAYHAGDTAAGDHFAEIAARVGAIDWAMLPIGGYEPRWFMSSQHIGPEEAGDAFLALGARHLLAMHWGTFRLTDEAVGAPPTLLRAWWRARDLTDERLWVLDVGESRRLRSPPTAALL